VIVADTEVLPAGFEVALPAARSKRPITRLSQPRGRHPCSRIFWHCCICSRCCPGRGELERTRASQVPAKAVAVTRFSSLPGPK
jgi:hypothetical protein